MKFRLLSVGAAAAVAAAVIPAHAASGAHKPQIVDPAGDANAINNEGVGSPFPNVPSTSTPADDSAADIRSVLFQTTFKKHHKKKVVTGSTVTMTLSATPQPQTMYRVIVKSVSCDLQIFLEYETTPASPLAVNDMRCAHADLSSTNYAVPPAAVKGKTIVWTLPAKVFPVNTTFTGLSAETRANPVAVYAPVLDQASTANTFTVGK